MFERRAAFIVTLLLGLMALSPTSIRASWELGLTGASNNWYYGRYTQMGNNGFFGPYDVDNSATANYASLNAWVGSTSDINSLTSGSNAAVSAFDMNTEAAFGNEYMRLSGRYKIEPYTSETARGSFVTMSPAQLALWSIELFSPVAKITYGKESFQKGFGLQFDHSRSEEFLIVGTSIPAPNLLGALIRAGLLPRSALNWFSPNRWSRYNPGAVAKELELKDIYKNARQHYSKMKGVDELFEEIPLLDLDDQTSGAPASSTSAAKTAATTTTTTEQDDGWPTKEDPYAWATYGPGMIDIGFGFYPWNLGAAGAAWNQSDVGSSDYGNYFAYLNYALPELVLGIGCLRRLSHLGPELQQSTTRRLNTSTNEAYTTEGWAFIHYVNSRFFFKTELDRALS